MTPRKLTARLRKLGRAIDEATDGCTNYGGCCVVASIVADELAALGIAARGVVATWQGESVDAARPDNSEAAAPADWNRNGLDFNHVGLEIDAGKSRYLFDSEGVVPRKRRGRFGKGGELPAGDWPIIPGYLTREEMRALSGTPRGWNDAFPRSTIPTIRELAHRILAADDAPSAVEAQADDQLLLDLAA